MCFRIDWISGFAVWRSSGVAHGLQTPPGTPDGVWRPSGVAQGPPGCWGGAPGGNRETVFLSPPIRGQPRNSVSVTPRSPFSVMGDRPSSVGGAEKSLSVGGDLCKKCDMLIYPSRQRRGDPRESVLELIGFAVSQSGGPQGCLLYTSPSPRDGLLSRMPSSA